MTPPDDTLREALADALRSLNASVIYAGELADAILAHPAVVAILAGSGPAAGLREAIERETDWVYPAASPTGPRTPWQDGWNAAMERIDEILAATPTASPTEDES